MAIRRWWRRGAGRGAGQVRFRPYSAGGRFVRVRYQIWWPIEISGKDESAHCEKKNLRDSKLSLEYALQRIFNFSQCRLLLPDIDWFADLFTAHCPQPLPSWLLSFIITAHNLHDCFENIWLVLAVSFACSLSLPLAGSNKLAVIIFACFAFIWQQSN